MPIRFYLTVLLFFVLISLPFLIAELASGEKFEFGGFLLNPLDGNSYLAKMYQGWRGDWRFTLPYSAQPGEGAYLFLFYIFLGHLARLTHLPLLVVFHLARLVSAFILVWTIWRFLRVCYSKAYIDYQMDYLDGSSENSGEFNLKILQRVPRVKLEQVLTLAIFGLGMGWLVFPFGRITSDLWISETYPFLSAYTNPHFALGLALMLILVTFKVRNNESYESLSLRHRINSALVLGLTSLLLAIISPFGVVVVLVILGGLFMWELGGNIYQRYRRKIGVDLSWLRTISLRWVLVFLFGIPLLLYYLWVVYSDSVLAGWNAQNLTSSPPPWDLLLSLSPALILALVGGGILWRRSDRQLRLLLVWIILGIVFMVGLFFPIASLAGIGIAWIESEKPRTAGVLGKLVLLLSFPTTLLVLLFSQYGVQSHDPLLYLSRGEAQALEWIQSNTSPDALILASPETGLFIPARTGRRVIYGHPYETVNAVVEKQVVARFFQGVDDDERFYIDFLSQRQVDYVFLGPRERQLGNLHALELLSLVYSTGDVEIYEYSR